ncbi:MarR family winged helix-turn-helix transcriptional regulator [Falsibacillus pallidus]|uniref:DNA-binding MarR family transcriptional regulator n=1 Tax=Falsibacillus pallidus TaxID=493781 RepID=A0A370GCE0_9BACI|nr:MarR family transcriptional regulator [Falsibacillus pallidus]RDI41381.1 DNA-binding MarR family transcriptional regulator [Falsibacillus pallidus]
MTEDHIKKLTDQYIELSFSVTKRAENLIKCQIGDDLTNDQHYILRYIVKKEVCTSTELAEVFEVKKSAITAMINRMTEKGLIQRERDEKDRRVIYLTLSKEGKALFDETEARIHKLVASLIKKFDQEEIEQFIKTYEKLNKVILESKDLQMGE